MTGADAGAGSPIGVFDSGYGGLSILRGLTRRLPDQPFLYLGDHAHAPYGDHSPQSLYRLTIGNLDWLFAQGCQLALLACNTASSVLRRIQHDWLPAHYPGHRVLGVVVPTVEAVTGMPWLDHRPTLAARPAPPPHSVAVFATPATVASRAFPAEIAKRAPQIRVLQQPCPDLVPLIEAGAAPPELMPRVAAHVAALRRQLDGALPDVALLGCTHYPLIAPLFAAALTPAVRLVAQADLVADSLADYLIRHPRFQAHRPPAPPRLVTTGDAERVNRRGRDFLETGWRFGPAAGMRD